MTDVPDDRHPPRLIRPDGRVDIERVGMPGPGFFRDFYHLSIRLSWARFLLMLVAGWLATILVFGFA